MARDDESPSSQREIKPIQKLSEVLIETLKKNRITSVDIDYSVERYGMQEPGAAIPFYFFYFNFLLFLRLRVTLK